MVSARARTVLVLTTVAAGGVLVVGARLDAGSPPSGAAPGAAPPAELRRLPAVLVSAHRGGRAEVRENSLSGLRSTAASGAAQVLDMDVRLLADGTPVLLHDATVDRTTPRTGPASSYRLADWRDLRLDAGPGPPEPPPTVAEVLDELGGRHVLTLEAKNPAAVPVLARMIRDRGLQTSVLVNTNSPEVAARIHSAGLLTHLWRSARQMRTDEPTAWAGFVDVLDVDQRAPDPLVRAAVHSGVPRVWAHTVDTRPQRDRVLRLGIDGLVSDRPVALSLLAPPAAASG